MGQDATLLELSEKGPAGSSNPPPSFANKGLSSLLAGPLPPLLREAPESTEAPPPWKRRRRRYVAPNPARQAELEAMWLIYLDGATAAEVGAAFHKSKQAVLASFRCHGFECRSRRRRANPARHLARIEAALARYDQGITVAAIASEMG